MTEQKNKQDDAVQPQAKTASFVGAPCWNLHFRDETTGNYLPSFRLDGTDLPKVGDEISVKVGKQTRTGVVKHTYNGNCVAITAIKKEQSNG